MQFRGVINMSVECRAIPGFSDYMASSDASPYRRKWRRFNESSKKVTLDIMQKQPCLDHITRTVALLSLFTMDDLSFGRPSIKFLCHFWRKPSKSRIYILLKVQYSQNSKNIAL